MLKIILPFLILFFMLIFTGCSGDPTGIITEDHSVRGLIYFNPNDSTALAYAIVLEEGASIPSLFVYLIESSTDSTQINPIGGGAYLTPKNSIELASDTTYTLRVAEDFGDFFFSKEFNMADTFRVTVLNPASRIYNGGTVSLSWQAPSQDFGYFLTVDPPSSTVSPYTIFVNSVNNATIPADAFTTPDGERVPGIYRFYVVAFYQTFYSDALIEENDRIFFPYPDTGFEDNIDRIGVEGRFGTAVMSYYDSVEVIANP